MYSEKLPTIKEILDISSNPTIYSWKKDGSDPGF